MMNQIPFKDFFERYQNKVRLLHLCDYLLFVLFAYSFLVGIQADLVSMTLHKVLRFPYFFCPSLVSLVLTALLVGVQIVLNRFLRLKGYWHAVSFVPSFLILTLFTALLPQYNPVTLIAVLVALLLFVLFLFFRPRGFAASDSFWTLWRPNLLVVLLCFGFITLFSNTDETFHNELKVQRHLLRHHPESALRVGEEVLHSSRLLLALRAYALSEEHLMGENLFEYPIPRGVSDLFVHPYDESHLLISQKTFYNYWGFVPADTNVVKQLEHQISTAASATHVRRLGDYWLCTLLMQKRLDDFVQWLPRFYNLSSSTLLPKHYREALILYRKRFLHPRLVYQGSVEDNTNYTDFMEVCRKYPNLRERNNQLRRLYGNTYWWYFYFH